MIDFDRFVTSCIFEDILRDLVSLVTCEASSLFNEDYYVNIFYTSCV